MKTLLVAVDMSRASARVAAAACRVAQASGARVVLLHVVAPPPVALRGYGFAAGEVRTMLAELERRTARRLRALARRCGRGGVAVETVLRAGEPAPTILSQAAALRAAMLVVGSHGHSAAYDLIVGSTTQRLLRRSRVPVLVVPASARRTAVLAG